MEAVPRPRLFTFRNGLFRSPAFYRPAYGVFNLAAWVVAPRLGMRRTMWSGWARDWEEETTSDLIVSRALAGARPGAILLLHDSDGSPGSGILWGLSQRRLEPVTLTSLVMEPLS